MIAFPSPFRRPAPPLPPEPSALAVELDALLQRTKARKRELDRRFCNDMQYRVDGRQLWGFAQFVGLGIFYMALDLWNYALGWCLLGLVFAVGVHAADFWCVRMCRRLRREHGWSSKGTIPPEETS